MKTEDGLIESHLLIKMMAEKKIKESLAANGDDDRTKTISIDKILFYFIIAIAIFFAIIYCILQ